MIEGNPDVEFIGEIGESEKASFLGGAAALLFPIDWPEPFGLAMIEAMACGTPVIAYRRGSVPEIVEENVSGFVVDTLEEAVTAVRRIGDLNRVNVRAEFERRFTDERMAHDYVRIYRQLLAAHDRQAKATMPNGERIAWQPARLSSRSPKPVDEAEAQPAQRITVNSSLSAKIAE